MKRTLTTYLIALAGCAALVLSACGGGGCNPCEEPGAAVPKADCAASPAGCK